MKKINDLSLYPIDKNRILAMKLKDVYVYIPLEKIHKICEYLQSQIHEYTFNQKSKNLNTEPYTTCLVNTFKVGDKVKIPKTKSTGCEYAKFESEFNWLCCKIGITDFLLVSTANSLTDVIGLEYKNDRFETLDTDSFLWQEVEHYDITNIQMNMIINILLSDGYLLEYIGKMLRNSKKIVNYNIISITYDNNVVDQFQIQLDGTITFLK